MDWQHLVVDNNHNSYNGVRNMVAVVTTVQRVGAVVAVIKWEQQARQGRERLLALAWPLTRRLAAPTLNRRPVNSM